MKQIHEYEVIFFDAGGTLLHPYPSVGEIYQRVAMKYGSEHEAVVIEEQFMKVWLERDGLSCLTSSDGKVEKAWWKSLVEDVFNPLGGVNSFDTFFDELHEIFGRPEVWKLYPETLHVLKAFQAKGQRMAVISNWDSRLLQLCQDLKLDDYFESIIVSAIVGKAKPGKEIFEAALSEMNVLPENSMHIGDSLEDDVRGAHRMGIQPILINRHDKPRELDAELSQKVPIVQSLRELLP